MGRLIEQSLAIVRQIRVLSYFDFSLSLHVNIANYKESREGIKRNLENHVPAQNNAFTNRLGDDSQRNL